MAEEKKLTREEIANIEIGSTEISRPLAVVMVIVFLVIIFAVPIVQTAYELRNDEPIQALDIYRGLPAVAKTFKKTEGGVLTRTLRSNAVLLQQINEYEDALEDQSLLTKSLLGPTQALLLRFFSQGNEKAYPGKDGWLFFRPGIDYVTGPPFLDEFELAKREASGNEYTLPPQPDPRQGILDFHAQLKERGIQLVIVPAPVKAVVHPEKFSGRFDDHDQPLQNPSFAQFKKELEAAGVLVYDPAPLLVQRKLETGQPQYLDSDTHWTPAAMDAVAQDLAAFVEANVALPEGRAGFKRVSTKVTNLGDIANMLNLPAGQTLYPEQTVEIQQVLQERTDLMWRSTKGAPILVLGDSFSNIYSLGGMGWGESAGFIEQLGFHLKRPLDRLARNDAGAFATRQMLSQDLARGRDRLAGKTVVIWEFASRELAVGDWKMLPLKVGTPPPSNFILPEPGKPLTVTGVIEQMSPIPPAGSTVYKDLIIALHLRDLRSPEKELAPGSEVLVFIWAMRNAKRTPVASWREGREVTLVIKDWDDVVDRYESFKMVGIADDDLMLESPCWAEEVKQ